VHAVRAPGFVHTARHPLERVSDWPQLPPDIVLDRVVGVAIDSRGRIYLAHRGLHPLLCLRSDGTLECEVGSAAMKVTTAFDLRGPTPIPIATKYWLHGLSVDAHDNVWVTDVGRHLVMKFSPAGKLLMTLGRDGASGTDRSTFNQPTHVLVVSNGDVFVTDGYGNSRVVKFSADGQYLQEWGAPGTLPGQFHTPHIIVRDHSGRLCISDRENDRIQTFDETGKVQEVWEGLHSLDGLHAAKDGHLYGSCGIDNAIVRFGPAGTAEEVWATPGLLRYPHALVMDAEGALLVAETGDQWQVTGSGPNDRQALPRSGPEGSRLSKWRLPAAV
jgi:sugar lactone lactonase YvrE